MLRSDAITALHLRGIFVPRESASSSPQLNGDEDAILDDEDAIMLTTLDFNEVILD